MIKKISRLNKKESSIKNRMRRRFEALSDSDELDDILVKMDNTAHAIIRYGMENTDICDLTEEASEKLDVDYHDKSPEVQNAIDKERDRMEDEATECCAKLLDAIDSIYPVSKLKPAQKRKLEKELKDLNCYGAKPLEEPSTYVKCIVADYVLHEDNDSLSNFEFACENALEEDDDDDMDESVKSRRSLRMIKESAIDDLFDEWVDQLEFNDIKYFIPNKWINKVDDLKDLKGQELVDELDSLDIIPWTRLYKEFELISENDEYWYNRKIELEDEDDDMDESVQRRRRNLRRVIESHRIRNRKNK